MAHQNTIIRTVKNKDNPYSLVNRQVFEDDRISYKAKGMMGYLLTRPDDWTILQSDLEKRSPDGRDAVRSGFKELEKFGYVTNTAIRDNRGRIERWEKRVFEQPDSENPQKQPDTDYPDVGFPDVGFPDVDNPQLLISNSTNYGVTQSTEEKQKSCSSNARTRARKIFIQYFSQEPTIQQVNALVSHLEYGMQPELIQKTCSDAVRKAKHPVNYAMQTLSNLSDKGVLSVEQQKEPKITTHKPGKDMRRLNGQNPWDVNTDDARYASFAGLYEE